MTQKEKKIPIAVYESDHARMFELKCAWRLDTYAETLRKLLEKASKTEA
jgi:hypothetical protein